MGLISISDAKESFSKFVNRVAYGKERLVITSHGQPKAALVSVEDLRCLEEMEEKREAAMLAEAVATETEFYSVAEVEAELSGLATTG